MPSTTYDNAIQQLYVQYFGRPADVPGLQYWSAQFAASHGDTTTITQAFAGSAEYKTLVGGQDALHVINAVYLNLFGHAADVAGANFWAANMASGALTIDVVVKAIAAGAQSTDLTAFNDKIAFATAFTASLNTSDRILGYSGTSANFNAKAFVASVVDDVSLAQALATLAHNGPFFYDPVHTGSSAAVTAVDAGVTLVGLAQAHGANIHLA